MTAALHLRGTFKKFKRNIEKIFRENFNIFSRKFQHFLEEHYLFRSFKTFVLDHLKRNTVRFLNDLKHLKRLGIKKFVDAEKK